MPHSNIKTDLSQDYEQGLNEIEIYKLINRGKMDSIMCDFMIKFSKWKLNNPKKEAKEQEFILDEMFEFYAISNEMIRLFHNYKTKVFWLIHDKRVLFIENEFLKKEVEKLNKVIENL